MLAIILAVSTVFGQGAAPLQATVPKMIKIDGSKTPSQIPQYVAWEWLFRLMSRRDEIRHFSGSMGRMPGLTDEDRRRLYDVTDIFVKRQAECDARRQSRRHELEEQEASALAISREAQAITLECRSGTLELADKLMDAVSRGSRKAIQTLLDEGKRGMFIVVDERELQFFRLPR